MPIIEALKNIPGSLIGRSARLERGERAEVTEDQAHRLARIGYAEQVGGEVNATPAAEQLAQDEDVDCPTLRVPERVEEYSSLMFRMSYEN